MPKIIGTNTENILKIFQGDEDAFKRESERINAQSRVLGETIRSFYAEYFPSDRENAKASYDSHSP